MRQAQHKENTPMHIKQVILAVYNGEVTSDRYIGMTTPTEDKYIACAMDYMEAGVSAASSWQWAFDEQVEQHRNKFPNVTLEEGRAYMNARIDERVSHWHMHGWAFADDVVSAEYAGVEA